MATTLPYYQGTGRRKTSVARVRLVSGEGQIVINGRTYEEHFGTRTPATNQKIGFQSMFSAKQIAEYVAMKRLGLDATFTEGPVTVSELVCDDVPAADSACRLLNVGDTIVTFRDTPAIEAFIKFLTTPQAAAAWCSRRVSGTSGS